MPTEILIIQRCVPHYRVPLFQALHARYGVKVLTAANLPDSSGLKLADGVLDGIVVRAPFVFPDPSVPERARYPIDWMIRELSPEIVISEFGLRQSSAWTLPIARRRGRFRRLIFWTHGWIMERGFRKPLDLAVQLARLPAFAAADVIATYGEEGAQWLRRQLPWKRVVALGNPLDQEPMRAAAAATTRRVRNGNPQLLSIGRLKSDKDFDRVLRIFRHVRAVLPEAALTIIGDGPERSRLEEVAGDDLGNAVRLLGAIYGEAELAPHFLGADLYVLAGAAGLSVNHALSYGLPVVAFPRTPIGPFHHPEIEYVIDGRTGLLVDRYDDKAMAETIVAAVTSGRLAAMREEMANRVNGPTLESFVDNFGRALDAARN